MGGTSRAHARRPCRLKAEFDLPRYKFVVQVLIGEQRGEGIRCAILPLPPVCQRRNTPGTRRLRAASRLAVGLRADACGTTTLTPSPKTLTVMTPSSASPPPMASTCTREFYRRVYGDVKLSSTEPLCVLESRICVKLVSFGA